MNWDAIGAIGELLGALVVVISVVYLAGQVRQNTAASRAEALRSFSIEVSNQFLAWATDERTSGIWHKIMYEQIGRSDFPPADMMTASFCIMSRLNTYDAAFRSYKEGILTEEEFRPMLTTRIWDTPFVKDSWPIYKRELSPDFVQHMENELPQLAKQTGS